MLLKAVDSLYCIYREQTQGGTTELPFEFRLEPLPGQSLYETYHGVFVNIQYTLTADMPRGMLAKNLSANLEFIVEKEVRYMLCCQHMPTAISRLCSYSRSSWQN